MHKKPITFNGTKSITIERWLVIVVLGLTVAGALWAGLRKINYSLNIETIRNAEKVPILSGKIEEVEKHVEIIDTVIVGIRKDVTEQRGDIKWMRQHWGGR